MAKADETAVARFRLLRLFLEEGVPLAEVARSGNVSLSTVKRWVRRYRAEGIAGLARRSRADKGKRRVLLAPLQELTEGLALRKPRRSIAAIHRVVTDLARERGWAEPSYDTIHSVVAGLDPGLCTLAHEGDKAYADAFELLHRREASGPNAIWESRGHDTQFAVGARDLGHGRRGDLPSARRDEPAGRRIMRAPAR